MSQPFVGEIRLFAGNFAPQGWALCDGQLLSIADNDVLFALIGTTYGGDGQTTFALPDLRGRVPQHTGPAEPLATMAGFETVTLTAAQMPAHTHLLAASTAAQGGDSADPTNRIWAPSDARTFTTASPDAVMHATALAPTGSAMAHDNMMPFLAVNYIISLFGIFPSSN